MKRLGGVKLLDDREGEGQPAQKGDRVTYNVRLFLNKGEEVPLNASQAEHLPKEILRIEGNVTFVDHQTVLGSRQTMAGIEHALMGMKAGGYRKVRISPHLAYREKGLSNLIPPQAVLTVEVWLRHIIQERTVRA